MRIFLVNNPETGYTDRIKAKDHADAAKRWGAREFDTVRSWADIQVSGLKETTSKAFHVEFGIIVEAIA